MSVELKLNPEALTLSQAILNFFDDKIIDIKSTGILGQQRAQAALEFGINMPFPGYNLFVMGEAGWGRLTIVKGYVQELAKKLLTPDSYAYVDNFNNTREPKIIRLPSGHLQLLCQEIDKLIDNLLAIFPAVFESPSYQQKKSALEHGFRQTYEGAIELVEKRALTLGIALFRDGEAINFAPIRNNKILSDEQFIELSQSEREEFDVNVRKLEDYLSEVLIDLPQWRRTLVESIKQLDDETIQFAVLPMFSELEQKYKNIDDAYKYFGEIKVNLKHAVNDFLMSNRDVESKEASAKKAMLTEIYMPTILVDWQNDEGGPVVYEPHPTYQNLFGRIDYINDRGSLTTSYRNITSGSLHKANGGYLVVDAEKLLSTPYSWEALKRAVQLGKITIESNYQDIGMNAVTLRPQEIPLDVKVILLGTEDVYYYLEEIDSEFSEMFKVLVDFDQDIPLNSESINCFAGLTQNHASTLVEGQILTPAAITRLIEYSCRRAENQQRLSAHVQDILDVVSEAHYFSQKSQGRQINQADIESALDAREYRNGKISKDILEEMLNGTVLIDTEGEAIGKINGLTVLEIGGSCYGAPARITATVYPGSKGIVDIEREVELGQAIHSKGVMILSGYLGYCYAQQFPLAISASIAIEQSYGYVDGDSASLAELCCLISALTKVPIKQAFAVTGSVNQYGEVQVVGAINEKIEGFFQLCHARGLNEKHGVIIPAANQRHLVLKREVIEAVRAGLFSIYAVKTVDQALELLTGKIAGTIDKDGHFPADSINFKAVSRLKEISDLAIEEDKEDS